MNEQEFKNTIKYYVENGMYPDTCPESIKDFVNEEADSLHTLKIKLTTQRYAISNLLSIADRCDKFGIKKEAVDKKIRYPNVSIPGSEIDYTDFLENMIEAAAEKKYNLYVKLSNIEGIDMDEIIRKLQNEYEQVDLNDICIEEIGGSGCSNTLTCENINDRL